MSTSLGIVGMPNAGKSTLFNLITGLSVPAENYPFNTIEPNIGVVSVKDLRIKQLAEIVQPAKTTFPQIEFHDIAGLVKGAATGEGLGNKFLANIREVDAIVMVIRGFGGSKVEHTLKSVDPKRDREVLLSELILKDIETVARRESSLGKVIRDEKSQQMKDVLTSLLEILGDGRPARALEMPESEDLQLELNGLHLLTMKPIVYLLNTDDLSQDKSYYFDLLGIHIDQPLVVMDVALEADIISTSGEEVGADLLAEFGLKELGINQLIKMSYRALDNEMYLTAGKEEVRGWTFDAGATAPQAAGEIHTDFIKKFIAAEVATFEDYIEYKTWDALKQNGKVKLAGRDYIMHDGDVVYFKIAQ